MKKLNTLFGEIEDKKGEVREIKKHIRESLASSSEYQDINGKVLNLKTRRKQLEIAAREPYAEKLDILQLDIKDGQQNMSDVALNMILKGEKVEIMATDRGRFEPVFRVNFKKT